MSVIIRLIIALAMPLVGAFAAETDSHGDDSAGAVRVTVTEGPELKVEQFADKSMVTNVTAICFDDQGRLYVTESHRWRNGVEDNRNHLYWLMDDLASQTTDDRRAMLAKWKDKFTDDFFTRESERVVRLQDTDGDGKADARTVFAEGFNDELDGPAIGLLSGHGKIYMTSIPHVWTLEDADGDGVAEKRESLHEGFGPRFSLSGHDLHGLTWGPDGKLYFSIGDRGYHIKTKEGSTLTNPGAGAAFRCDPDGANLEVFYYGLRNPQELAFNEYGDLFTVDNNCDQGDEARVSYLMEGGDTGWHMGHQALTTFSDQILDGELEQSPHWMSEGLWKKRSPQQPEWILPAVDYLTMGPSGMVFNSGTSLSPRYRNHFLVCDYKGSSNQCFLYSFKVKQEGAGYAMRDPHIFHSGITAADVDIGFDGKIYLGDFGGGWVRPDRGNIFTLADPAHIDNPVVADTQALFANGIDTLSSVQLGSLLTHLDQRVRQRAQFALVERKESTLLEAAASNVDGNLLSRLHGIWGLRQLKLGDSLIPMLDDKDPEVRAQTARTMGELRISYPPAVERMIALLADESARVQAFSAIALGKVGAPTAASAIQAMLARNADVDAFLRHAGIMGLKGCLAPNELAALTETQSRAVRIAACIALRKLEAPEIVTFLDDPDPRIVIEAIRAINDLAIEEAYPAVQSYSSRLVHSQLPQNQIPDEMVFRRLVNVNFRSTGTAGAKTLMLMASNPALPVNYRAVALQALAVWPEPPPIDPSVGIYRPLEKRDVASGLNTIREDLVDLLASAKESVIIGQALRVANAFDHPVPPKLLRAWLMNAEQAVDTRLAVLNIYQAHPPKAIERDLQQLYQDNDSRIRVAAADATVAMFPDEVLRMTQMLLRGETDEEKRGAYRLLAKDNGAETQALLNDELDQLVANKIRPSLRLDVYEACSQRDPDMLQALNADLNKDPMVGALVYAKAGGDPRNGALVFANQGTCKKCHNVECSDEFDAGPSLEGVATRLSIDKLLESIVKPYVEVVPGYGIASITLTNGEIIAGTPLTETDTHLTIKTASQEPQRVAKTDIASRTPAVSPMPPMGAVLPKSDVRDLIAYLALLK